MIYKLIAWLMWRRPVDVGGGVWEVHPRRFAYLVRPLWRAVVSVDFEDTP